MNISHHREKKSNTHFYLSVRMYSDYTTMKLNRRTTDSVAVQCAKWIAHKYV